MSSQNTIVVNADARGRFIEGTLTAGFTPKPGQCVQLVAAGTYSAGVNANARELIVLVEESNLGKTKTDAYTSGSRFRAYIPVSGDEVQLLGLLGEDLDVGEAVDVAAATGKCIAKADAGGVAMSLEDGGGAFAADKHHLVRFV